MSFANSGAEDAARWRRSRERKPFYAPQTREPGGKGRRRIFMYCPRCRYECTVVFETGLPEAHSCSECGYPMINPDKK